MKLVSFFVLMAFIGLRSNGQEGDFYLGKRRYPFINYQSNSLSFPGDSGLFDALYSKYDSIILFGKGKLNIIHIGGSHIQADVYSHQVRKRMQTIQFGTNGGRGFVFPYSIAKTNTPSNYKVRYTGNWTYSKNTRRKSGYELGLSGVTVRTNSNLASIRIDPNQDSSLVYSFNQVRVYHPPSEHELHILSNDSLVAGTYIDSLGYSVFKLPSNMKDLHIKISRPQSESGSFDLYGISLDSDSPGVVYNSIGVNGAHLSSYLKCKLYELHLKSLQPDLVILSIGTNDGNTRYFDKSKYKNEYRQLIRRTLAAAPQTKVMLTVPNDCYLYKKYINQNTAIIKEVIFELAKEFDCAVWDFYTIMGGLNSSQTWYNYHLMKYDRIHFNRAGYHLKGELFFSAFLKSWEKELPVRKEAYFRAPKPIELQLETANKSQISPSH